MNAAVCEIKDKPKLGKLYRVAQDTSRHWMAAIPLGKFVRIVGIPVPPMIERAMGYSGDARYVAFWCRPCDTGQLCWSDGKDTLCSGNVEPWFQYRRHPRIAPFLHSYDFGEDVTAARHRLVLDRQTRTIYIGTDEDVERAFMGRPEAGEGAPLSPRCIEIDDQTLEEITREWVEQQTRIAEQVAEHYRAGGHAYVDMQAWLRDLAKPEGEP